MKRIYLDRSAVTVLWVILTLSACTLISTDPSPEKQFDIVAVPSDHAVPERIMVTPTESGFLITGVVHKKSHGSGHIRGHVDIELISSKGLVLAIGSTRYFHPGRRIWAFKFSIDIKVDKNEVKKIIVTHHAPTKEN